MPEKREKRNIARTEIINYMLNHSVTSKAELAKELGLSMPTVLTYVNELIAKGLIVENGEYASTGGRKAKRSCLTVCLKGLWDEQDHEKRQLSAVLFAAQKTRPRKNVEQGDL